MQGICPVCHEPGTLQKKRGSNVPTCQTCRTTQTGQSGICVNCLKARIIVAKDLCGICYGRRRRAHKRADREPA